MRYEDSHPGDQELLMASDGELAPRDARRVQAHLAHCWTCRTRMREIEETIADFVRAREAGIPQLPQADGPRALLKAKLAQLSSSPPTGWARIGARVSERRAAALLCAAGLGVVIGISALCASLLEEAQRASRVNVASIPDPELTPGATLPVTREELCAAGAVEAARVVPVDVARNVFAAYGIDRPEPRAYEVDYLITPALGGSDNIRNFWPQPYKNTVWNAHVKDALEEHLRRLVCEGQIELARAQQEIATDWIGAYKKYFRTARPLPEHATFLKDRPWE